YPVSQTIQLSRFGRKSRARLTFARHRLDRFTNITTSTLSRQAISAEKLKCLISRHLAVLEGV
ncbi:hypothetical protein ACQ4M4_21940, partial [Leptolyngbya sp. AN02str]|uniref:hypothetical protein n=1 Tax=Leptolyngbya sp. AN02str TaxID=3423363 RepID=UPI003D31F5DF